LNRCLGKKKLSWNYKQAYVFAFVMIAVRSVGCLSKFPLQYMHYRPMAGLKLLTTQNGERTDIRAA